MTPSKGCFIPLVHLNTQAANVLIATGTKPTIPKFPGSELCSTSDDMLDLPSCPKRVVIVGSGYIGKCAACSLQPVCVLHEMYVHGGAYRHMKLASCPKHSQGSGSTHCCGEALCGGHLINTRQPMRTFTGPKCTEGSCAWHDG